MGNFLKNLKFSKNYSEDDSKIIAISHFKGTYCTIEIQLDQNFHIYKIYLRFIEVKFIMISQETL